MLFELIHFVCVTGPWEER